MKIVLQCDGSISIVPVENIKETLIEVRECTLEQFERNFPQFLEVVRKFKVAPLVENKEFDPTKEYAKIFYETIANKKKQESFSTTEIDEIIGYARDGFILIGVSNDLKGIKYIRIRFQDIDNKENIVYFAESQRENGKYYLINNGICSCKSSRYRHWCAHLNGIR